MPALTSRTPPGKTSGRRGAWLAVGLVVTCAVTLPAARAAQTATPPTSSANVSNGDVVSLRAPASAMVLLRGGTFQMGSSAEEVLEAFAQCRREPLGHRCVPTLFADEQPEHPVTLSDFWLDRTEVTVREYERCVAMGRCSKVPFGQGGQRFDRPSFPVTFVTWHDAVDYCNFRGKRLPTEAEFERAARGLERRRFPWGNLFNARLSNHGRFGIDRASSVDGFAELAPVGSFPGGRTPDGIVDLAGNVAEWVLDHRSSYPARAVTNPRVTAQQAQTDERVVRGGDWTDAAVWLRGAARKSAAPNVRLPTLGFRCARSARRASKP